jgi:hypothetical protein
MDGFTPELRINKQLAPLVFETLKINQTFPTKAEAARFALEVAKKWIDDGKPIPHKHGSKWLAFLRCRSLRQAASVTWAPQEDWTSSALVQAIIEYARENELASLLNRLNRVRRDLVNISCISGYDLLWGDPESARFYRLSTLVPAIAVIQSVRLYYGAADTSIGLATGSLRAMLEWLEKHQSKLSSAKNLL